MMTVGELIRDLVLFSGGDFNTEVWIQDSDGDYGTAQSVIRTPKEDLGACEMDSDLQVPCIQVEI